MDGFYSFGRHSMGYFHRMGSLELTLLIIMTVISLIASFKVQRTFAKYSRKRTISGYTGEQAAKRILMTNNISIPIQPVRGSMTDFYNPVNKSLALSEPVYGVNSIAALGVAAHEAGHAIQDANDYAFLRFRHAIYPVVSFASGISMPLIMIGIIFSGLPFLIDIGIGLFAITTVFAIITLPVEFNASKRALASLEACDILTSEELRGAKKVLSAAALTYVAAAVVSILSLLRLLLLANRHND